MKQLTSILSYVLILAMLLITALSCSKKPNGQGESLTAPSTHQQIPATASSNEVTSAESTRILMEEEDENSVVLRLIGEGDNGIWRLRDEQNEIQVQRIGNDMLDIKANGGNWQINTQIKAKPGERVVIAGIGNRTLSLELPVK